MEQSTPKDRIDQYLSLIGPHVKLKQFLGSGTDGAVWSTNYATAIKACNYDFGYWNERDSYLRLEEFGVTQQLEGFWIPKMLGYDDELWVVEMDLMQNPPYIIDFAKVRINTPPDFSQETIEYHEAKWADEFGQDWPRVQRLLRALESFQIYYTDPSTSNIVC
jgi:hypothetical protein